VSGDTPGSEYGLLPCDDDSIIEVYHGINITQYRFYYVVAYINFEFVLKSFNMHAITRHSRYLILRPVLLEKIQYLSGFLMEYTTVLAKLVQRCLDPEMVDVDRNQATTHNAGQTDQAKA